MKTAAQNVAEGTYGYSSGVSYNGDGNDTIASNPYYVCAKNDASSVPTTLSLSLSMTATLGVLRLGTKT